MAEEEGEENMAIVGVLIGLIVFLSVVLVWIMFPPLLDYIRTKMPVSQKRIDRRYSTIDGWLISKRVQPHNACCDLLIKQLSVEPQKYYKQCTSCSTDTSATTKSSCSGGTSCNSCSSNSKDPPAGLKYAFNPTDMLTKLASIHWDEEDTDELEGSKREEDPELQSEEPTDCGQDDSSESTDGDDLFDDRDIMNKKCAICLEKFRIGESVSWSCDITCQHVFHHACLRNWLLRRIRCPCCRTIVLPVDKPKQKLKSTKRPRRLLGAEKFTSEEMSSMASVRAKYVTRTYFCVEKGLVILRPIDEGKQMKASASASSCCADKDKSEKEDEVVKSCSSNTPSETKRNFLFWKRKRQQNSGDAKQRDLLNTTGSICSDESFGDSDSHDEEASEPCHSDRRSTCRTVRMGSGSTDAFEGSEFGESDLEASQSTYASETELGFASSSCGTSSDDDYGHSCRTNEDEGGHSVTSNCRTNEEEDDYASSFDERSDQELIDCSEGSHTTGMEIVHLDNV
ncbi:MAG: hypothetical protein SGBAC_003871 [Bacillariaceae sp.]